MDVITGTVQNYAWGSTSVIPGFLGVDPDGQPQAELWFGAHPVGPSQIGTRLLPKLIEADPVGVIGSASVARFGPRLPFLLKVLAAAQPLSLQAHPSRASAEAGFAREEAAGIDRSAPERLYRDDWPKPEMMVALDRAEALCGFREPGLTFGLFTRLGVPAAVELVASLESGGPDELADVFARVLVLDAAELVAERKVVAQVVRAAAGLLAAAGSGQAAVVDAELVLFARTAVELDSFYPADPGVLAGLLMNRLSLRRFEGLFLPAGNLHAYLRGTGVEIMANSDNVMRGGLTPKHIDVAELVSVLDFTPGAPELVEVVAEGQGVWRYVTPAPEFVLWRVDLTPENVGDQVVLPGAGSGRVVLVVEGSVEISDQVSTRVLSQGAAVYGYPAECLTVTRTSGANITGTSITGTSTVMVAASGV